MILEKLGPGPVAVDASIFIYWAEGHAQYADLIEPLFRQVEAGHRRLWTSALTVLEVLVHPYRELNRALAHDYMQMLSESQGVVLVPLDANQLDLAARIRARTGAKTPDALQLAAGLASGCRTFLTNDTRIRSLDRLQVVQLRDLVQNAIQ